jgi:hypothetical protein
LSRLALALRLNVKTIRWNEEFIDDVKSDLMVDAHKFEESFQNITEDGESIDGNVDNMLWLPTIEVLWTI